MNKISLYLMTNKGFTLLESIIQKFGTAIIDCVITAQDKNIQNDYFNEIIALCKTNGIKCYNRSEKFQINSSFSFAISWRWLISIAKDNRLIVFHDSILPRYRGFAPLVNSLINKESEIGVTALYATESYDCGDIIGQLSSKINYPIKIEEAIKINNENYINLAQIIIKKIMAGDSLVASVQEESNASYSLWRDEDDYIIDWKSNSTDILQFIYSVGFPYNGASTLMDGKLVRILDAELMKDVKIENRVPGKIIFVQQGYPVVVCGEGLLKIKKIIDGEGVDLIPINKFRIRFR